MTDVSLISDPIDPRYGLDILWHAIGMDRKNYRKSLDWWLDNDNHRNSYCVSTEPPSRDLKRLDELVARGLMKTGWFINDKRDRYYHVTQAGIRHAKANYPRPAKPKGGAA